MMKCCSHCGQAVDGASKFCASCGNKVEVLDKKDSQLASRMKRYLKRQFYVYGILLVFILIVGCVGSIFLRK